MLGVETRRNGNAYYYRKRRIAGRVVSEYVGAGEIAELARAIDLADRSRRAELLAARREWAAEIAQVEQEARDLGRIARDLAALALLVTGHYCHRRSEWRRRTGGAMPKRAQDLPPLPAPGDDSTAARMAVMARCDRPDAGPDDLAALRDLLRRSPSIAEQMGNLMRAGLDRAAAQATGTPLWQETQGAYIAQRRAALGYADAPALEKPLIDHLLTCETRLALVEMRYTGAWAGSLSWADAKGYDRLLSAAQRRYLQAVETLARVRRVRVELARVLPDGTAQAAAVELPGG